jgi:hypothetical protein
MLAWAADERERVSWIFVLAMIRKHTKSRLFHALAGTSALLFELIRRNLLRRVFFYSSFIIDKLAILEGAASKFQVKLAHSLTQKVVFRFRH